MQSESVLALLSASNIARSSRRCEWEFRWFEIMSLNLCQRNLLMQNANCAECKKSGAASANSIPSELAADPDRAPRTLETKRLAARGNQSIMR
jgi:hypothetical protein